MSKHLDSRVLTTAFCIAVFPPIWAVLAPHLGVTTGAVALICAGMYVTNGNKISDAVKMSVGFLLGDFWACIALWLMEQLSFPQDIEIFTVLFGLGAFAVLIGALFPGLIHTPSWLCGWAIGLTILSPSGIREVGNLPIQIAAAMLAGIWYVGVLVDKVQRGLEKIVINRLRA